MSRTKAWHELGREKLLDCRIFEVERSTAESPMDGRRYEFYRVRNGAWVQIVPVTADDRIVMVRQFRHGSQSIVLEVPGGLVDAGETPAEAAMRECLEETGYRASTAEPLAALNPNPAIHTSPMYAFTARPVVRVAEAMSSGTEQTEVVLVPVREVPDLLRSGAIDHALVAATLWRYLDKAGICK